MYKESLENRIERLDKRREELDVKVGKLEVKRQRAIKDRDAKECRKIMEQINAFDLEILACAKESL